MATEPTNISIERVLKQDIPDIVSYCNHILLVDNLSDMRLFSHPARLRATTVEKARVFDPLGHAGFDPSGKIRLPP